MPNVDEMSEAELDALLSQPAQQKKSIDEMSEAELDALLSSGPQQPQTSVAQTALEGFGQGATLSYLPQIQAAAAPYIEKGLDFIMPGQGASEVDEQLKAQGFKLPEQDTYLQRRDENIQRQKLQAEQNPMANLAGNVAGALSTAFVPGGAATKGLSTAAKIGRGAAQGGIMSAIANPGDTEGELSPLQLKERAEQAKTGALIGGSIPLIGSAMRGAQQAYKGAGKSLEKLSKQAAFKSTGAMLKDFRKAFGRNKVDKIGSRLLDEDLIKAGDSFEDIAKRVGQASDETGSRIGEIYKMGDEAIATRLSPDDITLLRKSTVSPKKIAQKLEKDFREELSKKVGGRKALKQLKPFLDDIKKSGDSESLSQIIDRRRELDELINWSKQTQDMPIVQQKLMDMRNAINDAAFGRLKTIDKIRGTNLADDLKKANDRFSDLITVKKIAEDRIAREASNRAFSLGDRVGGVTGALAGMGAAGTGGAIIGGLALAGLGKLARQRGGSVLARSAEKAAKIINSEPKLLGRFGDILTKSLNESPEKYIETLIKLRSANPDFDRRLKRVRLNNEKRRAN